MATRRARPTAPLRSALLCLGLSVVVLGGMLSPERRAAADGPPPAEVVPAVEAAYPPVGTLAVVVAPLHVPVSGLTIRAREARTARLAAATAGNAAADLPLPTASMVKLFIAEDVLHRIRSGRLAPRADDPGLLERMIRSSDDPAASTLWVRYGAGQMVTDVARRYGLTGTAPPASPGQWGSTTTTARDLARFLALLPTVAHRDDVESLLTWMRGATPVAADGFDQRFGLLAPTTPPTAVKQGWMCCTRGNRHVHSVGVVGQRVVVLLSEVSRAVSYAEARAALTAAAAAVPPPPPS